MGMGMSVNGNMRTIVWVDENQNLAGDASCFHEDKGYQLNDQSLRDLDKISTSSGTIPPAIDPELA